MTLLLLFLAILPIPVIYFFYYRYFLVKPSSLYHLENFLYGSILALLLLLAGSFSVNHLVFQSAIARGFLSAALVEKAGAFLFILALTYRTPPMLMVLNMTISAMLLGLGFATVENIVYALAVREPVIVVRLFSSVPLHVLTCGLMGYCLALMRFSGSPGNRLRYALGAFAVPLLFHGLYDTMLMRGGDGTYWIAPLLVMLIMGMEYIIARSQTLPLLDGLRKHRMSIEEWRTIQREPQHARWILRSMGSKNREYVPFFRLSIGKMRGAVIVAMIAAAAACFVNREALMELMRYRLAAEETVTLFTLLPALYCLNLFIVGVVNPKYFQNSMIRIPIIIDVDMAKDDSVIKTITYHVTAGNCYLKTVDPISVGTRCLLVFTCSNFSSPQVPCEVIWDSRDDRKQLSGTLVRLTERPWGYRAFLMKYYLYRVTRGLFFNLRLPGFKSVRQLFVRPVSVMQKEWRFGEGHVLFEQGEEGKVFYLIRKGKVDIVKTLETGEKVRMVTLSEGDIFGEMAIVGNQPRLATAVCRTECLLAVAEADNLDVLIENNPVFAQRLIKIFANRLHASEQTMLKSMADAESITKKREDMLMAVCKLLYVAAGLDGGGIQELDGNDAALLSSQLGLNKDAIVTIYNRVTAAGGLSRLDEIIRSIIDES
ncbi:MAG TPA: cyclic nucleotide-binding domain-containing protein [Spirochaetota bacterium]|nr:cyclic nucleotide-binding domain-containing protein [Spirochaetota bacterium]HPC39796.1 cyclic nucleotide-binding domain-containing protein [Spirochaetota bacterium]HPL17768.1 cyclic nucleotide-binding domain-containing protein [Spirochaetota bacterium]HQJ71857.1 cyclic nucleotide-binding domain-containing protein [Spirochaetota bacterium]HRS77105.1 cyclic nucleotide-binding domain-containing protein [Spirochaetota bacterium]